MAAPTKITGLTIEDLRFPTSLQKDGSDAMHKAPDYAAPYIILETDGALQGCGSSFTAGRGNQLVCMAIDNFKSLVVGQNLQDIFNDFSGFWRSLASEDQIRWLGPEKGVTHLAIAAIINAVWDLWAKMEGKPLWKLLADMSPEMLVSTIDFRHMGDTLTKKEALEILKKGQVGKAEREAEVVANGYPAYTTSCGWLGYSDEKIKRLATEALSQGMCRFKMKVGGDVKDDARRAKMFREIIGYDRPLMMDANQKWEVDEAIDWMKQLAEYKPLWIEEPTNPDDILGHAAIAEALNPLGIGVATGEHCQNRIMFKQFLKAKAMQYCQIDATRVGGVNENLAIILLAAKFGVPVCPHAGGVALCELVQHYSMFDFICVSGTMENRMIEFADHLHEHMSEPVVIRNGSYQVPKSPGFVVGITDKAREDYIYPEGKEWQRLFSEGLFTKPE
ncbi:mitochondrial enolase superfamily member 1-like isoform X2 [Mizuhopecten yessoensis]|uniref:mitochondrial enolase superfamily member 1-like isoform X2 n=1 Tax=Mizuhopecten yessoensis TaxID=6573 RepID=UPI000B45ED8E|nr:mitochondrial enolase superfamily member 1-like isoform X2 [Mizuhopecten yessoensis]